MGFFKSVGKVISAPVALPAKVFSNILDTVAPDNPIAAKVSDAFQAPWEITKNGGSADSIKNALNMSKDAISLASAAATGGGSTFLGFDAGSISGLTDMFGNKSAGVKELPGYSSNDVAAPATPFRGAPSTDFLTPALVIGGAGILAYFLFRSKK